jgi:hypothetical protein
MRYEELHGPLEGWTYDENGTIHTASGYKCTARQIEFCMWMYDVLTGEAKRWMIRSDERPGATRPLFESSDLQTAQATVTESDAPNRRTDRGNSQREKVNQPLDP